MQRRCVLQHYVAKPRTWAQGPGSSHHADVFQSSWQFAVRGVAFTRLPKGGHPTGGDTRRQKRRPKLPRAIGDRRKPFYQSKVYKTPDSGCVGTRLIVPKIPMSRLIDFTVERCQEHCSPRRGRHHVMPGISTSTPSLHPSESTFRTRAAP